MPPIALALAGTAGATALGGTAHAEPRIAPAEAKAEVDRLHREAEKATEKYNGAKEEAGTAQRALDSLRDGAARRTEELNTARDALGSFAAAQYRWGAPGPSLQLVLSSSPDQYLKRASLADRAANHRATAVSRIGHQLRGVQQLRSRADGKLAELRADQAAMREHKETVNRKLADAERLLDRMTGRERAALLGQDGASGTAAHADRSTPRGSVQAPTERAALAVSYAWGALGKPYGWGSTGPSSYDCSGLTQAAWRSAGVSLPRTTYTQIKAGAPVSRSQLAPGDLVFFYSGISHVGLYIGNGQMIHAPRPGAAVRVAPIDEMPFSGATRPA